MSKPPRLSTNVAIAIIESAWIRYRDRQLFQILKMAVRTLETFMSSDILRRTSPKDYELLRDSCLPFTLRFRFSGNEFPPVVVFKIFTDSNAVPTQYVSPASMNGRQQVKDKTKFYSDLVKVRGPHSVTAQLLQDEVMHTQYGIMSPEECVTTKDCLKLKAIRDELPAYMGGKGNTWRKLTLADVPRMTILHDVLGFALGPKVFSQIRRRTMLNQRPAIPDSRRIRAILPYLMASNDLHMQFRVLTTICRDAHVSINPTAAALALAKTTTPAAASSERRRAAKARAKKLLNLYTSKTPDLTGREDTSPIVGVSGIPSVRINSTFFIDEFEDSNLTINIFDAEADELFEWSKNLPPVDDII